MSRPENPDFSIGAKRQIARAVRRVLSTPADGSNYKRPAVPRSAGSSPIHFGKLSTTWPGGQSFVELTPVLAYNDPTATGEPNGHAIIQFNDTTPVIPAMLAASVGDILAYVVLDASASPPLWMLVDPPILPRGSADFQMLQMSGGVAVWDKARAS